MRRTPTSLARLLAALVVTLLVALAGTTASVASTTEPAGASASGRHQVDHLAVVTAGHRTPAAHRHVGADAAAWFGAAAPVRTAAHPLAAPAHRHAPVVQTSFCSSDRAPPV
jgi:hypothetical protein